MGAEHQFKAIMQPVCDVRARCPLLFRRVRLQMTHWSEADHYQVMWLNNAPHTVLILSQYVRKMQIQTLESSILNITASLNLTLPGFFRRCEMTSCTTNTIIGQENPQDTQDNLVWWCKLTLRMTQTKQKQQRKKDVCVTAAKLKCLWAAHFVLIWFQLIPCYS